MNAKSDPKDPQAELYHLHSCHSRQSWVKGMTEPFPCDCGLTALFQAREQQLLNELLGELPDKRLKRNGEPTTNMATAEWGFNQAIDQVVSVIEKYREGLHE